MHEEQFFISLGCPLEDAVTLCNSLRRDGKMEKFIEKINQCCDLGFCSAKCPVCHARNS